MSRHTCNDPTYPYDCRPCAVIRALPQYFPGIVPSKPKTDRVETIIALLIIIAFISLIALIGVYK